MTSAILEELRRLFRPVVRGEVSIASVGTDSQRFVAANPSLKSLTLYNGGSVSVFWDLVERGVSTSYAFALPAGQSSTITAQAELHMATASSTATVRIYEESYA